MGNYLLANALADPSPEMTVGSEFFIALSPAAVSLLAIGVMSWIWDYYKKYQKR